MTKKYSCLNPTNFSLDGGAMFGIIPRPLWKKLMPPDSDNRVDMALRLMLIQTKNKNILIDTGIGDYQGDMFQQRFHIRGNETLTQSLFNEAKIRPNEITDVIISHLHFDHVGGLVKRGPSNELINVFQKATIHLHRDHYSYALKPTPRDTGSFQTSNFLPILEKLEQDRRIHWLEGNSGEIFPEIGIKFKCSHGHTPYMIHPYDENFIYMADLIPTSHHISIPWVMGYDISPGITSLEKSEFLSFISENNLTMVFEHDPIFTSGKATLNKKKKGYIGCDLQKELNL